LLLGFTGFVFATGLSGVWVAAGIASGIIFSWLVLAKRFRKEADKYNVLTLPDYLAVRFKEKANIIRWLATVLIASFFMFYVGAQLAGAGKLFLTSFEINETSGIIIATIVIIATSYFGGFLSVVWTDMIQSIDRKSTRLNSSHVSISYAVFCLKKKKSWYNIISMRAINLS